MTAVDTLSLIVHIYWIKIINNIIQNPALQKDTKLNISQLNLRNFRNIISIDAHTPKYI